MKAFSIFLPVSARLLLLSSVFWIGACRENTRQTDTVGSEAKTAMVEQEASSVRQQGVAAEVGELKEKSSTEDSSAPDEQITELRREIDSGRQDIENIEAFVQMERAKLEENPDYDPSFMLEALDEQQDIRETVEFGEERLRELTGPDE